MKKQAGLTLIELMVVMLILTSLTIIGAVKWLDSVEGKEVSNMQLQAKTLEDALNIYSYNHSTYPSKDQAISISEGTEEVIKTELVKRGLSPELYSDLMASFKTVDPVKVGAYLKTFIEDLDKYFFVDSISGIPGYNNDLRGRVFTFETIKYKDIIYSGKSNNSFFDDIPSDDSPSDDNNEPEQNGPWLVDFHLQATSVSDTNITLSWSLPENVQSLFLRRNNQLISSDKTSSLINDNGLLANSTYTYELEIINQSGQSKLESLTVKTACASGGMCGSGTLEDPFIILTFEHLGMIKNNLNAHYALGNNIDITGKPLEPIGTTYSNPFRGSLDGRGLTITGLSLQSSHSSNYHAMFSNNIGASFKNLLFDHVSISSPTTPLTGGISALVGLGETTTIDNVHISGTINSGVYSSGLLAHTLRQNSSVTNTSSSGSVSSTSGQSTGGLIGGINDSTVAHSHSSANVSASLTGQWTKVGGLLGFASTSVITHSHATGNVQGTTNSSIYEGGIGGLIGYSTISEITYSYATGNVSEMSPNSMNTLGGLVGAVNQGTVEKNAIQNSYATGNIIATQGSRGGLVGAIKGSKTGIRNSYATGQAFRGFISTALSVQVYAGDVCDSCGCYPSYNDFPVDWTRFVSNYWDTQTSGATLNAGGATGRTTTQMQTQSTYSGWDFTNIWTTSTNEYPRLR